VRADAVEELSVACAQFGVGAEEGSSH
jgi:hypothetical protein